MVIKEFLTPQIGEYGSYLSKRSKRPVNRKLGTKEDFYYVRMTDTKGKSLDRFSLDINFIIDLAEKGTSKKVSIPEIEETRRD